MRADTTGDAAAGPAAASGRRELKLSTFEGPLDLLLHLIEKESFDITSISLVQVTGQYMALLHADADLDPAALAEFVSIGSKLLYLKSRALLPRPDVTEEVEDEVAVDLTQALLEYRRYKEVARLFREREEQGLRAYPRHAPAPGVPLPTGLGDVTGDTLMRLLQEALTRQPKEEPVQLHAIERDPVTLRDRVEALRRALRRGGGVTSFRKLVLVCRNRVEVIVQFMAVLELIKAGEIAARQDALFTDIELVAAEVAAVADTSGDEGSEAIA